MGTAHGREFEGTRVRYKSGIELQGHRGLESTRAKDEFRHGGKEGTEARDLSDSIAMERNVDCKKWLTGSNDSLWLFSYVISIS